VNNKAGHFHHPFGEPSMTKEAEEAWRLGAVKVALEALKTPVEAPTVFEY
tara:strand:- start:20639 stop:20788 length:150 start_codon:yes stop_codon:yes gene_type:complete